MGFAGMAGFPLLPMNFAHLLKEDKYFLLVFSLLDFKMYSPNIDANSELSNEVMSTPAAAKAS